MGFLERIGRRGKRDDATAPAVARAGPRLGVIGPGLIWQKKHRAELAGRGVDVVAVCARSPESFDAAGVPGARRHADVESLLGDGEVEAVAVLTPIPLNAPTAIAALEAGKHVFVEKPLGRSLEECRAVRAAEAASGKRVYVLEQAVYRADIVETKRLLDAGRIGDLVLFDRIDHFQLDAGAHDAGGFGKTAWRRECDFPLGSMLDAGVHAIAQLSLLFGTPVSVTASGRKWREEFGDHDEVLVQLEYAGGLRGVFSQSGALPTVHSGFNIRGTEGVIRPTGNSVLVTDLAERTEELPAAGNDMWERLLACHAAGSPPPYTSADAARDVAVLEAVARAIESGARERVERIA